MNGRWQHGVKFAELTDLSDGEPVELKDSKPTTTKIMPKRTTTGVAPRRVLRGAAVLVGGAVRAQHRPEHEALGDQAHEGGGNRDIVLGEELVVVTRLASCVS